LQIRVGLENNIEEGRFLAVALDFPGAFSYGQDESETLIRLPKALLEYDKWVRDHTSHPWQILTDLDIRVVERFTTYNINEKYEVVPAGQGYQVNAWFKDDWRPLTAEEIAHALQVFHWQRDELLAGLSTLTTEVREMESPGQRWNINGIADHVANAELWYLSRLNLTDMRREDLPPKTEERLDQTLALIDQIFPEFESVVDVRGIDGEFWSFRKIVRRTLWHQRDHIEHIKQLVFAKE
jgi:uncharacterized damage-inducible protein DinB